MVDLTFQKVDVRGQTIGDPMTVKYAPAELTLAKSAQYAEVAIPGLELPVLQFVRGEATTLSMDLFFDSTEAGTGTSATAVTADAPGIGLNIPIRAMLGRVCRKRFPTGPKTDLPSQRHVF